MIDYARMDARIRELPDTPSSMRVLLDEFPQAKLQDWWLIFFSLTSSVQRGEVWPLDEDGFTESERATFTSIIDRCEAKIIKDRSRRPK
jgi:hypothetical protein